MIKKLVVLYFLSCSMSVLAQTEYLAVLTLKTSLTIRINPGEKPSLVLLANLSDTLHPIANSIDTLSYFTRHGILKIKWEEDLSGLHYYYSGIWSESPLYPISEGGSESIRESFYNDETGNVAWLKWSDTRKLPLLYSPYRKYRSYLIPIAEDEYLNSQGDRIKLTGGQMMYSIYRASKTIKLNLFEAFEREEVYVMAHGDTLFGYLYKPIGKEVVPGCLLLQGGGSVGIENYLLEAEFMAAHGIATAIFNKSGEERSRGNTNFRFQSFREKLDEYAQLFEWLCSQEGIDPERTGVHGMSEGGRLSIDLGARPGIRVAFVISVSGPFSSFADNQLYAINRYLHGSLWPDSVIAATTALWARYYHEVTKDSITLKTQDAISELRRAYPRLYLPPEGPTLAADLRKEDISFMSSTSLKKVKAPILFQLAEMDQRVDVHRTANSVRQQRENSGDWLKFYPQTAHGMADSWGNITSGYLYDKIEWLESMKIINQ